MIVFCSAGCAGTDKVGVDLVEYVNQDIIGIAQVETKALARYAAVTGQNYTDDPTLLKALNEEVIPLYKRFLHLLRQVDTPQEEIRQLHSIYISGAEDLYAGFKLIRSALERTDEALVRAANTKIESGRLKTDQWRERLLELYEIHGVKSVAEKKASVAERQIIETR